MTHCNLKLLVGLLLAPEASGLRLGNLHAAVDRRGFIAAGFAAALPTIANAGLLPDQDDFQGYKVRDYGSGANTATGAKERLTADDDIPCAKGIPGCKPDGRGGYERRTKQVKPLAKQALEAVIGDDGPAPAAPTATPQAAPKAAPSTRSSDSGPALSRDELITKTIAQKEEILGRPLSAIEREDLRSKVDKLLGS
jgi:hypothetical protein